MNTRIAAIAVLLATAFAAAPAEARWRFNHRIYFCTLTEPAEINKVESMIGAEVEVFDAQPVADDDKSDLRGKWAVSGVAWRTEEDYGTPFHIDGYPRRAVFSRKLIVRDRPEPLAEEPRGGLFKINPRTLKATYRYRRWAGYAPIGFPYLEFTLKLKCEKRDEYLPE